MGGIGQSPLSMTEPAAPVEKSGDLHGPLGGVPQRCLTTPSGDRSRSTQDQRRAEDRRCREPGAPARGRPTAQRRARRSPTRTAPAGNPHPRRTPPRSPVDFPLHRGATRSLAPFGLVQDTMAPGSMSLAGIRITTRRLGSPASLGALLAARSMPRDSSPRMTRGARLATMMMERPMRSLAW